MIAAFTERIDDIAPSPHNPRKSFDQEGLEELADSIRAVGVLQPILIRDVLGPESIGHPERGPRWMIVAGERRWRAAKLAGLERIPANFVTTDDETSVRVMQIVENVQREDLSPMDFADALADLLELGLTQTEAAKRIGLKGGQSRAAHLLKLRELPGEVKQILASSDHLKTAHAEALTRWNTFPALAALVARTADAESWTARMIAEPDLDALDEALETEHQEDDPPELFVRIYGNDVVERAGCEECPWQAFVKREAEFTPNGAFVHARELHCLRPEHFHEIRQLLNREPVEAMKSQFPGAVRVSDGARSGLVDAAVAAARVPVGAAADASSHTDSPPRLPSLRDLGYGTYEPLDRARIPRECSLGQCACYGKAIGHDGRTVVAICTNKSRFASLQSQLTKARNAENKRRQVEATARIEEHVRAHSAVVGSRDLLLMLSAFVTAAGTYGVGVRKVAEAWQDSSRTWLHGKGPSIEKLRDANKADLGRLAANLAAPELLKAVVEALCRADVELRFDPEGGPSYGALAEWYVGELPKRAGDDWQPPEKGGKS